MIRAWVVTLMLTLFLTRVCEAADNMRAFPPAEDGMVRYALQLPSKDDESAFMVGLIIGKLVQVDERNKYFFSGKIEADTIKGWGFTRYKLSRLGPMVGTRMAVDPGAPKVERFIALGGHPYLVRYNSRLPIMIYVPKGVEVRYRIWTAGSELEVLQMD